MTITMKDWNKLSASEMAARDADTLKTAERIYEMYFSKVYMYHTVYSLTNANYFFVIFSQILGDTTVHTQKYWKKGLLKSLLSKYL